MGGGSAWDSFQTFMPDVFYHDGQFHMFYVGSNNARVGGAIGYATSTDGLNFTKHPDNPVLVGTAEFPNLVAPELFFDGQQWVMYVNGGEAGVPIGEAILRATASELSGPWHLLPEPMMGVRGLRPWDRKSQPATIFQMDEGLAMYYMGIGGLGIQMGLAHSPDGINWTRHDNPDTGDRLEGSDPILAVGATESWDVAAVGTLEVLRTDDQWQMFYIGSMTDPFAVTRDSILTKKPVGIGFATSEDGVQWTKHPENPVITLLENCWPLLGAVLVDDTYFIYYDQNCGFEGISVLTGSIAE